MILKNHFLSMIVSTAVVSATTLVASLAMASAEQLVATADGQVMSCMVSQDVGRMAYRVKSVGGVIKAGNVEVSVQFETLKCGEKSGVYAFEASGLAGRSVNSLGGFVEFSNLELVAYTPDLKAMKTQAASLLIGGQSATFVIPVASFVGLLQRNVNGVGDRRVTLTALLRGQAMLGEAKSGKVQERTVVNFGTYNVVLSEAAGNLTFAQDIRALSAR